MNWDAERKNDAALKKKHCFHVFTFERCLEWKHVKHGGFPGPSPDLFRLGHPEAQRRIVICIRPLWMEHLAGRHVPFAVRSLVSWQGVYVHGARWNAGGAGGQGCFKDRTPSFPWSKLSEFLWGTCLDVRWCAVKECEPCKTKCIRTLWCFTGWTCLAYIWNSDTRRCWVNIDKSNKMSNIQHLAAWTSKVGGVELNHTM